MASFTEGPWVVDENGMTVRAMSFQMKICDIRGWGYLTGGGALGLAHDYAEKIQLANAYLIAAAPALYASLKEQVDAFDKQIASYRANGDDAIADVAVQVHGKRIDAARAVLAGALYTK